MFGNLLLVVFLSAQVGSDVSVTADPAPASLPESSASDFVDTVGDFLAAMVPAAEEEVEVEIEEEQKEDEEDADDDADDDVADAISEMENDDSEDRENAVDRRDEWRHEGRRARREREGDGERPREIRGVGLIAQQVREQAERIERLEDEVRRLRGEMERVWRRGGERDQPRRPSRATEPESEQRARAFAELRDRVQRDGGDAEARVSGLEQALARLRERSRRQPNVGDDVEPERREEQLASAQRRAEEAKRRHAAQEAARQLEQIRAKRVEARREYEAQRDNITRAIQLQTQHLEQQFKQADQAMERAIAELERRLARQRDEEERAGREDRR